jgi:hypothetical protein
VHCLSVCRCGAPAYDYDKESCRGCFVWPKVGEVVGECLCGECKKRVARKGRGRGAGYMGDYPIVSEVHIDAGQI